VTDWRERPLDDLLAEHGLDGAPDAPFPTDGWSGATFRLLERDGRRFVLKHSSPAHDWIVRATRDDGIREAWLAATLAADGDPGVATPYLGAAVAPDGGAAILMRDLTDELGAWRRQPGGGVLEPAETAALIERIAALHASTWSDAVVTATARTGGTPPWCPLPERLTLLTPRSAAGYAADGNPVAEIFLRGWAGFERFAPPAAVELVDRLGRDPSPLVAALAALPSVGLHGDIKLANVARLDDDHVAWIDWQMTLRAPVAVELGWCIVTNSAELPFTPDEVMARYRAAADPAGADDAERRLGDWDAQCDLAWIVGLLLRGWRKGADTANGVTLGSGVAAADDLAWWAERAVAAAGRRL
jgi:hypothetical protein